MNEYIFIKHSDLSEEQLNIICELKSYAWKYSILEQKKWIENNIKDSDIHVLLKNNENYVAYLNLIEIKYKINSINKIGFGIGNVCSKIEKKGYGSSLILGVNEYILDNKKTGLLFCKTPLINFYITNQWNLINKNYINIKNLPIEIHVMGLNLPKKIIEIEYKGFLF